MAAELTGRRVAFLTANEGVEQAELTEPWAAVRSAGGEPVLVAPEPGKVQAFRHLDKADMFDVDMTTTDALEQEFDALMLPGGVANADDLRTHPDAVHFVRSFFESGKPIAVICHGPWILIDAGIVRDRTLTSWPSLSTDLTNAGAEWVDQEVHVDTGSASTLVSSRKPGDLPAFCTEMIRAFAGSS
jgi:protease I